MSADRPVIPESTVRDSNWLGAPTAVASSGADLPSDHPRRPTFQPERRDNRRQAEFAAERAVPGSILIDGPVLSEILEILTAADFSTPRHVAIFQAMEDCYSKGIRPDNVGVGTALGGEADQAHLAQLVLSTPTSFEAVQYARLVAEAARRRRIAEASTRIVEAARGGAGDDELGQRLAELQAITARLPTARAAIPLVDYLRDPAPVHWAIPSLAVVQSIAAVVAPPESMKTFFLLQAGLACAGSGDLLGLRPDPMPFLYVSNEKSPATVRERFRRMVDGESPTEEVLILHRAGATFGRGWDLVRRALDELGKPALVALDTLASLSGAGFDENSGQAMGAALSAMRSIVTDFGATILLAHHPNKHPADGAEGGARLRGHSSLWGEVDSVLTLRRHSRDGTTGTLVADVKDGARVVLGFEWSVETFRLRDLGGQPLSIGAIRDTVSRLDGSASGEQIKDAFPGHSPRTIERHISDAIDTGAIERIGKRGSYRYACRSRVTLDEGWQGDGA